MNSFKTHGLALAIILGATLAAFAQEKSEKSDKLSSAKIGYITSRLDLSPKQAEAFWPLYNEYDSRKKGIRKQYSGLQAEEDSMSDKQSMEQARAFVNLRESEAKLDKEYFEKFSRVLTGKQVLAVVSMDREFARLLIRNRTRGEAGARSNFSWSDGNSHYYHFRNPVAPLAPLPPMPAMPVTPATPGTTDLKALNRQLEQVRRQEKTIRKQMERARREQVRTREREDSDD